MTLRPAGPDDVPALAAVHLAARRAAPMPASPHPESTLAPFLRERLAHDGAWVAEREGEVVAYARFTATWLDDLYVAPAAAGQGIGSMLLALVQSLRPAGIGLWVFEVNTPARAFYARHGFVEVERTDGADNDEGEPDVRMVWPRR